MSGSLLEFFTTMDNQGGVVVKDAPKFDLELYIQNYRGRTKFERLLLIGQSSVALCVEALKQAVAEAKRGRDISRYREAVDCLRQAAPLEPEAKLDQTWITSTELANESETNRLVKELKGYKHSLVKESIRMGHEDLGKHFESIGELNGASEAFSKMRPDISTPKQLIDVGRHLVRVAIQRREWGMIQPHLAKMALGGSYPDDEKALQPYQRIATGIAFLGMEKYPEAAQNFLAVDPNIPSSTYNDIASRNDVAVYGGLLALGTMDRNQLQGHVLDNSPFRTFLELEPHIRKAVSYFVNGRYSACIETLEEYRADYLLDLYLQKHISIIYAKIRSKCIVQYLIPFSCVTLDTMSRAFGSPEEPIEEELAAMIQTGVLDARINIIDRLVTTVRVDSRARMQAEALESAEDYERQAIEQLRRMGIVSADLELKATKKMGIHSLTGPSDLAIGDGEDMVQ